MSGLSHSHPGLPAEAWGESVFHIVCLLFNVASLRARALSLIPPRPPHRKRTPGMALGTLYVQTIKCK